jgi:tRNA(Ile)-lysidine synthase
LAVGDADGPVQRLAGEVMTTIDGRLTLSRQALAHAPLEAVRRVVSAALVCTGGGVRPPRGQSLTRLIDAIAKGEDVASTLCGARVAASGADDAIAFGRDAGERARGGLAGFRLDAGERGVFDGRVEVQALSGPLQIAALAGSISRLDCRDRLRLRAIPAWARGALPGVIDGGGGVRLPSPLGEGPATAAFLVGARFSAACGLVNREVEVAASPGIAL